MRSITIFALLLVGHLFICWKLSSSIRTGARKFFWSTVAATMTGLVVFYGPLNADEFPGPSTEWQLLAIVLGTAALAIVPPVLAIIRGHWSKTSTPTV